MTHGPRAVLLASLSLAACGGGGGEPAFAVPHGDLQIEDDGGLSGHLVWELYDRSWRKTQDPADHLCALVMEIDGLPEEEGCLSCEVSWLLAAERLETDCASLAPGFGEPAAFGFGDVPRQLASEAQSADQLGWYVSWNGETWEGLGFARSDSETSSWAPGEDWTLRGGFIWELGGAGAGD